MRKILDQSNPPSSVTVGTAGVFWPSILWPDNTSGDSGGAASLSEPSFDLGGEMKKVFQEPSQQQAIDRLMDSLQEQLRSDDAVDAFIGDLKNLLSGQAQMPEYHDLEQRAAAASTDQWRQVLDGLADTEPGDDSGGGAAGLGDVFSRMWKGAKAALRVATYWQMKSRAGVVGRMGLAPLLNQLSSDLPTLRGICWGIRLGRDSFPTPCRLCASTTESLR